MTWDDLRVGVGILAIAATVYLGNRIEAYVKGAAVMPPPDLIYDCVMPFNRPPATAGRP